MKHPAVGVARVAMLVLLASCNSDSELSLPAPPVGYPTAYATADCAPADGPAVRLYLAAEPADALPPPLPYLDVAIWRGATSLSNERFDWGVGSGEGNARRCPMSGTCEMADSVSLRFRSIGSDTVLTGTVWLHFPDGSTAAGGFSAAWRSSRQLCG